MSSQDTVDWIRAHPRLSALIAVGSALASIITIAVVVSLLSGPPSPYEMGQDAYEQVGDTCGDSMYAMSVVGLEAANDEIEQYMRGCADALYDDPNYLP